MSNHELQNYFTHFLWHNQHSNGRSSLCIIRCCSIFDFFEKNRPHSSHSNELCFGIKSGPLILCIWPIAEENCARESWDMIAIEIGWLIRAFMCDTDSMPICCCSFDDWRLKSFDTSLWFIFFILLSAECVIKLLSPIIDGGLHANCLWSYNWIVVQNSREQISHLFSDLLLQCTWRFRLVLNLKLRKYIHNFCE